MVVAEIQPTEEQDEAIPESDNVILQVKFPLESEGYFYQHDDFPDTNSAVPRALEWLSMASALHTAVQIPQPAEGEKTD